MKYMYIHRFNKKITVRHRNHLTGEFRGASHKCDLKIAYTKFRPVVLHNLINWTLIC